jgi:hypothetical protein
VLLSLASKSPHYTSFLVYCLSHFESMMGLRSNWHRSILFKIKAMLKNSVDTNIIRIFRIKICAVQETGILVKEGFSK